MVSKLERYGIETRKVEGVKVSVYSPAKTVADCSSTETRSDSMLPSKLLVIAENRKRPLTMKSGEPPKFAGWPMSCVRIWNQSRDQRSPQKPGGSMYFALCSTGITVQGNPPDAYIRFIKNLAVRLLPSENG